MRIDMGELRHLIETYQVRIYFAAVLTASLLAYLVPGTIAFEPAINPALAFMLFVTFLQVPIASLANSLLQVRFLAAILVTNFVVVPFIVYGLLQFLPGDPLVRLGVLLVLLTPCIDYVVTFAQLGRADARLLLASTPVLLIAQMVLLPAYLHFFLGEEAGQLVQMEPFLHAFVWLIAIPLLAAALAQLAAARLSSLARVSKTLGMLPVPATAVVLFVVVATVFPQLGLAMNGALQALTMYIAYAVLSPILGWVVAKSLRLEAGAARAVAFSAATRNSLVVLPLALAVPNAMPLLPAVIVMQTLVELISELIYIKTISQLGRETATSVT